MRYSVWNFRSHWLIFRSYVTNKVMFVTGSSRQHSAASNETTISGWYKQNIKSTANICAVDLSKTFDRIKRRHALLVYHAPFPKKNYQIE